jgi:hypothetical protein
MIEIKLNIIIATCFLLLLLLLDLPHVCVYNVCSLEIKLVREREIGKVSIVLLFILFFFDKYFLAMFNHRKKKILIIQFRWVIIKSDEGLKFARSMSFIWFLICFSEKKESTRVAKTGKFNEKHIHQVHFTWLPPRTHVHK